MAIGREGSFLGHRELDDEVVTAVRTGRDRAWARLRRDPMFWVGGGLVALVILASALAPVISAHDPLVPDRSVLPPTGDAAPPSDAHPWGTDVQGRDYLSRILHGGRSSLSIAIGANAIALAIGSLIGAVAAMAPRPTIRLPGGRPVALPVETLLMRFTDLWLAFPVLLLAIALAYVIGASHGLVMVLVGGTLWTFTARLVYGRTRSLLRVGFVEAARSLGTPGRAILTRHLLPHLVPLLVVLGSLGVASAVLFEATLSYLGVGVPAPAPTWGRMVAETVGWYASDPRLPLLPATAVMLTVLGFNLLGDALRDALDPHGWGP